MPRRERVGDHARVPTPVIRTFHHEDFCAEELVEAKGDQRVSVCLPARDEEATVGLIVARIRKDLVEAVPLVDEILVIDDHSADRTAEVAAAAGARVVAAADLLTDVAPGPGKGEALWKSLWAAEGDLVAWCDADIRGFDDRFVVGILGPLLTRPDIDVVKGFYDRPVDGEPTGGGRVTELLARPLVSLLFPALAPIVQPLAGEYGGRRRVLEQLPFTGGYGVELGLLADLATRFGTGGLAQVDLGVRVHRNRPLEDLGPQAAVILRAALERAAPGLVADPATLARPEREPVEVRAPLLPPMVDVPGYGRRTA